MVTRLLVIVIALALIFAPSVTPILGQGAPIATKILYDAQVGDLAPVWSADGRSVLYSKEVYAADGKHKTQFYALSIPNEPKLILEVKGIASGVAWSPARQYILYTLDRQVIVRDLMGELVFQTAGERAAWSPDGSRLLIWTPLSIYLVTLDGSAGIEPLYTEPVSMITWRGVSWSPDGQQFVMEIGSDLVVFDVPTKTHTNITQSKEYESQPAWSPDGQWIAFTSSASYEGLPPLDIYASPIYIVKPDGSKLARISGTRDFDSCPAWSPDGRSIAFTRSDGDPANGTLFLTDLDTLSTAWLNRPDGKSVGCAQWSPDGPRLLFQAIENPGVSLYIAPPTVFISDVLKATLINRIAFSPTGISVYSDAKADSAVIGTLNNGTWFQIIHTAQDSKDDTWHKIVAKGDQTGWLTDLSLIYAARNLDPSVFCYDQRPRAVIAALREAIRTRDGEALAKLVSPAGLYMTMSSSKTLHLSYLEVHNFFNDHTPRDWGENPYSGALITQALADEVTAALIGDLTPANVNIACMNNQDRLSEPRRLYHLNIEHYEVINFYSVMRPGSKGNELDWGAWGIAFTYWNGEPVILGLSSYHWTP
jgi:Tol biopolymer transport system component